MRAYYMDGLPGDQRLPHDSGRRVPNAELDRLNVKYYRIPLDCYQQVLDLIAKERDYKHRDRQSVSKYEVTDKKEWADLVEFLYEEHLHEDEEIRYILEGTGFYDVRETPSDEWIRIAIEPGDLTIIPTGIYHRFSPDESEHISAWRLFKEKFEWTPLMRGEDTENNPVRTEYLKTIGQWW